MEGISPVGDNPQGVDNGCATHGVFKIVCGDPYHSARGQADNGSTLAPRCLVKVVIPLYG